MQYMVCQTMWFGFTFHMFACDFCAWYYIKYGLNIVVLYIDSYIHISYFESTFLVILLM